MIDFIKHQVRLFFTALMFYTRIPCPSWVDHDEDYLNKATIYFPFIGWIVGLGAYVAFALGTQFLGFWPAAVVSLAVSVLITGAFHEDGLADVCDAFGGGWTKEQILTIMKDSRLGTYGVMGLILALMLKVSFILELCTYTSSCTLACIFCTAHSLSRASAVVVVYTTDYARDDATSKSKPVAKRLSGSELSLAMLFGVLPLLLLCILAQNAWFLLVLPALWLLTQRLRAYFLKWIEGYTGDCLGATQQFTELLIYAVILVLYAVS